MANQNKGSSYAKVAKHFGVSTSSVQFWEKQGFDRDWSTEQQEAWRKTYTADRIVEPPLLRKKLEALNPAKTAEPVLDYKEARTQKLAKEIERLSIIIGREKGELVPDGVILRNQSKTVTLTLTGSGVVIKGSGSALALVTQAFETLFNTHTHPGNGDPPTQQMTSAQLTTILTAQ